MGGYRWGYSGPSTPVTPQDPFPIMIHAPVAHEEELFLMERSPRQPGHVQPQLAEGGGGSLSATSYTNHGVGVPQQQDSDNVNPEMTGDPECRC